MDESLYLKQLLALNNCGEYSSYAFASMDKLLILVENIGVEPMTSCVQGRRSSQLS